MTIAKIPLTTAALAAELGISKTHVRRWADAGTIPRLGVGRVQRYDLEQVRGALEAAGWSGNQKARRRADVAGETRTCSRCARSLPVDQFPPSTGLSCGWHCRDCRREAKREYRRVKAEREGRPFEARGDRATWKAKRQAARDQRKAERRVAWAVCLAFRALVRLSAEERRQRDVARTVARQRHRYATDPDFQAKRLALKIKRKRAMDGTRVVPVNRERVAARDGWRCSICGGVVTRADWSLDHVIPLSKGGEHTYDNVKLAHNTCNKRKGISMPCAIPRVH